MSITITPGLAQTVARSASPSGIATRAIMDMSSTFTPTECAHASVARLVARRSLPVVNAALAPQRSTTKRASVYLVETVAANVLRRRGA